MSSNPPPPASATFRHPDREGQFLWSCDCGTAGLLSSKGDPYTTRQGADVGRRLHMALRHGQPLPTRAALAAEPEPEPEPADGFDRVMARQRGIEEAEQFNREYRAKEGTPRRVAGKADPRPVPAATFSAPEAAPPRRRGTKP